MWTDSGPALPPPSHPCRKSPCHHPAMLRQLHRQEDSPGYLQHQLDLTPSSPTFLTSSPRCGSAAADEGAGTPFLLPGKARAFAAICSGFPTIVFAWPQQTHNPQELGQDQEVKSCTTPTDTQSHHHSQYTTSSPALIKPTDTHTRHL